MKQVAALDIVMSLERHEASGSTRHCHFVGGTWKQVAALDIVMSLETWKQVAALDIVTSLEGHGSKWQH